MKRYTNILIFLYSLVLTGAIVLACDNNRQTDKTINEDLSFARTIESTSKAVKDTVCTGDTCAVFNRYARKVTVTYDSVVYLTSFVKRKGSPVSDVPTTPPASGYTITFKSGYDTDADMKYGGNGQYANGTISNTVYKTGPGSFYSRPANVSNGTRSEVQYTEAAQNPNEGVYEYDAMYEVIIPNNGCSFQVHPNTGGSSGSPYLMHENGSFVLAMWLKGGGVKYYQTGYKIPSGKWLHFRHEFKYGSAGYWRLFIDGVKVIDQSGIQVGDGSGQYVKIGYNGWDASSSSSRIYFDNFVVYKKN